MFSFLLRRLFALISLRVYLAAISEVLKVLLVVLGCLEFFCHESRAMSVVFIFSDISEVSMI